MPTTQTVLFSLAQRLNLPEGLMKWLFSVQYLHPLREVDTSAGPYAEAVPPAGSDLTPGQSNQNQEITYIKISADANVFTLTGAANGPLTLAAQGDFLKIKSNGTLWRKSG